VRRTNDLGSKKHHDNENCECVGQLPKNDDGGHPFSEIRASLAAVSAAAADAAGERMCAKSTERRSLNPRGVISHTKRVHTRTRYMGPSAFFLCSQAAARCTAAARNAPGARKIGRLAAIFGPNRYFRTRPTPPPDTLYRSRRGWWVVGWASRRAGGWGTGGGRGGGRVLT
jgi:hypothetical protein